MQRLPPRNTLRAFEAVARHKRFIHAADELCLTHSAVSKQIKQLEEFYGVRLFKRAAAQVSLTTEGKKIWMQVADALELIARAPDSLESDAIEGKVDLLLAPAFAVHWLLPRLADFASLYPNVRINLTTNYNAVDVNIPEFDIAVIYGNPSWERLNIILLADLTLFPVCKPGLIEGPNSIRRISDLNNHVLLHDDDGLLWSKWLAANRDTTVDPFSGHYIPEVVHLLSAACEGCGIAMGDNVTTLQLLRSGALARPFKKTIKSPQSYYMVTRDEMSLSVQSIVFLNWLKKQFPLS